MVHVLWHRLDFRIMLGVLIFVGGWSLVRYFFKTRDGWWRRGEMLTNEGDDDDWMALL